MDIQRISSTNVIAKVLSMLVECYPGRFQTTEKTGKIWDLMLSDINPETIMATVMHLCSIQSTWPPDVATIRKQALIMANALLVDRSGEESWGKIIRLIGNEKVELDEIEREALQQTGKLYDLKTSQSPAADRARFIKAFDTLYKKRLSEGVTLPDVRGWVDKQDSKQLFGDKKTIDPQKLLPDCNRRLEDEPVENERYGKTDEEIANIKNMVSGILDRAERADGENNA